VEAVGYAPRGAILFGGEEIDPADHWRLGELALAGLLCSDARLHLVGQTWQIAGDPMEGALVTLAVKLGQDADPLRRQLPRADEIPFDTQHRFMATLHHRHEGGGVAFVKGAPERLLAMCDRQRGQSADEPLEEAYWHSQVDLLASRGQRVLALATRNLPPGERELTFAAVESGLTMLGLVGLIDPPRPEAVVAVADCREAGIAVKMITGDHAPTATAIARQLGLADEPLTVTGQELDAVDTDALRRVARDTTVFARTSPQHKLQLVEALQADGAVVAMTGDGVNDAPALKRANIGVAMGQRGSAAAKEASAIVLADDNFASIVAAVREGRTVYDNLTKMIGWTLPTNGGQAFAVIAAILAGVTLPVTPVQILWINLVSAAALGVTLAFEPTEPATMRRPPRLADEPILSAALLWQVAFVSLLFVAGAFSMFFTALERGQPLETARTIAVNTIVVMEIFYLFSVRYVHGTSLTWTGVLGTPAVLIGVAAVALAQLAFSYLPPMQAAFETRAVPLREGIEILGVGIAVLLVVEVEKRLRGRLPLGRQ
jgi:magnesium-transporting ATPase (P-type)